eukprot:7550981-Alexandrium_andersonii.AAC.1
MAPSGSSSSDARQLAWLNQLDMANRRVSFIFQEISTKEKRSNVVDVIVSKEAPPHAALHDRKLSKASYAEFKDVDEARTSLAAAGGNNIKFEEGLELPVSLKPAKTA